jgi:pyruvate kinase
MSEHDSTLAKARRRAKILCTLGPATDTPDKVKALIEAGMNAARLNFSHGSHQDHERIFKLVRQQANEAGLPVAVLADIQGPKIRVGKIPDPGMELAEGDTLVLSTDPNAEVGVGRVGVDYANLHDEVAPGHPVLMDDGAIEAVVDDIDGREIRTTVVTGGVLKARKGVNLPKTHLGLPAVTGKDRDDIRFAIELGVDVIALSFVRTAENLEPARELMKEAGRRIPIIAKIERPEAVENLESIIDSAAGIMVARGDLGVEMGPEEVPVVQKRAIEFANARGKLVITATQMLDSMIRNPRPTRAEASDVANAVLDGTDTLMLSGETATGKYPVRAVETMDRIIRRTEQAPRLWSEPPQDMDLGHGPNAIAWAAVASSRSLDDTQAIVVYTGSGGTARLISDYRPRVPVFAFTPEASTYQSLALYWGVVPVLFSPSTPGGESIFIDLDQAMLDLGFERGARAIIVMGWPIKAKTSANLLKLHKVGESLHSP